MNRLTYIALIGLSLWSSVTLANSLTHQTFPDLTIKATQEIEYYAAATCKNSDKPKKIGCKFTCKPCAVPVCNNGVWELEQQELGDSCKPPRIKIPNDDSMTCKIKSYEFCPPSCRDCTRE
ncbi:hypothetical protein [Thiofilum flexile]|uniref:hypothetical protein n=1 Tax=Thiofilum flexile TaxID=125627 RepID=UPI0003666DC6|nr:hypothetical protein [Thiofilum flexile]